MESLSWTLGTVQESCHRAQKRLSSPLIALCQNQVAVGTLSLALPRVPLPRRSRASVNMPSYTTSQRISISQFTSFTQAKESIAAKVTHFPGSGPGDDKSDSLLVSQDTRLECGESPRLVSHPLYSLSPHTYTTCLAMHARHFKQASRQAPLTIISCLSPGRFWNDARSGCVAAFNNSNKESMVHRLVAPACKGPRSPALSCQAACLSMCRACCFYRTWSSPLSCLQPWFASRIPCPQVVSDCICKPTMPWDNKRKRDEVPEPPASPPPTKQVKITSDQAETPFSSGRHQSAYPSWTGTMRDGATSGRAKSKSRKRAARGNGSVFII